MSDFLFARPNFLSGVARIFDFSGSLNQYNGIPSPEAADNLAERMDTAANRETAGAPGSASKRPIRRGPTTAHRWPRRANSSYPRNTVRPKRIMPSAKAIPSPCGKAGCPCPRILHAMRNGIRASPRCLWMNGSHRVSTDATWSAAWYSPEQIWREQDLPAVPYSSSRSLGYASLRSLMDSRLPLFYSP